MTFNKFEGRDVKTRMDPVAVRRSRMLRYAGLISMIFTAIGYGFIAYWMTR